MPHPTFRAATVFTWALAANLVIICAIASARIVLESGKYDRLPLDAYYYFEMARNMASSGEMAISFEQGLPNKFFPGYPLLLSVPSVFAAPDVIWPAVQVVLYLLCVVIFGIIVRLVTTRIDTALACAALLASNSILNKWAALPAAETAALAWLLAGTLFYIRLHAIQRWREAALCAGLCFGIAVLTRPDAAYFVITALVAACCFRNLRPKPVYALIYLCLASLPAVCYFLLRQYTVTQSFTYVTEFRTSKGNSNPAQTFLAHGVRLLRQPRQLHDFVWVNQIVVALQFLLLITTFLSVIGAFGRAMCVIALSLLGYLLGHSLWYYSSERFNVLALPLVCALTGLGLTKLLNLQSLNTRWVIARSFTFATMVILVCVGQVIYSPVIVEDHQKALNSGAGKIQLIANVATRKKGLVWSEAGPEFAYYYKGPVYMDRDEPFFYNRIHASPAPWFYSRKVAWLLLHNKQPAIWFGQYPDVYPANIELRKTTSDGIHTLYEVRYPDSGN